MMLGIDLMNELLHRLRWQRVTTIEGILAPEHEKLLLLINRALETMPTLSDWPMLQTEGNIALVAEVVGTAFVTTTQNSTTLTISSAGFDPSFKGRAIQVNGDTIPYRIATVVSTTEVELSRAWLTDSVAPADERSYIVAMDRYVLADDFDRAIDDMTNLFSGIVRAVSPEEFRERRRNANGIQTSDPEVFTVFGMNENETSLLLHFDPYPKDARLLEYPYIRCHPRIETDDDKVLFPKKYIEALIEVILYVAKRDHEDEAQLDIMLRDKMSELNTALASSSATESRHQLKPSQAMRNRVYRRFAAAGYAPNWGTMFDKVGNFDLPK